MNAERLHGITVTLRKELTDNNILDKFQTFVNSLQTYVQQQNNAGIQQQFATSRDDFLNAVTATPSDAFSPVWRQLLTEMGGANLFGSALKERVRQALDRNQMTPSVALNEITQILSELQAFRDSLNNLDAALNHFHIESEELAPGQAEIALLIPRRAVDDKLSEFANELEEIEFILNALSEVATGHKDDLKIRTISSSGLMIFLAASPAFGLIVAKAIDFVVSTYKKILEIKKLQLEITRLELPEEVSEKTKAHANALMEEQIEQFSVEIVNQHCSSDDGRKNELTTAVKISLNKMANRIDKGFNFEVRIVPPKSLTKDDKAVQEAVKAIQDASFNMQFLKLEGPPILTLPEDAESVHQTKSKKKASSKPEIKK